MDAEEAFPIGSAEGLAEARRRVAEAKRTGAEELDLGGLGLTTIPDELLELTQLKVLYLDLRAEAARMPLYVRTEEDKKTCNAVSALPPALFTSLRHLTHLHLEDNQLGSLPEAIGQLASLKVLTSPATSWGACPRPSASSPASRCFPSRITN
jgi:internalin A